MKLEILKDNKTTKARVGSIMIVYNHMGHNGSRKGEPWLSRIEQRCLQSDLTQVRDLILGGEEVILEVVVL